jgi:hypothetical protein
MLANSLFHRRCAKGVKSVRARLVARESRTRTAISAGKRRDASFLVGVLFLFIINGLHRVERHCAQDYPQKLCRKRAVSHREPNRKSCHIFKRNEFLH